MQKNIVVKERKLKYHLNINTIAKLSDSSLTCNDGGVG